MPTLEIPRRYWAAFLESFSRRHSGWLVRLEIDRGPGEADVQARDIALTSITVEAKPPEGNEISIMLGGVGGLTQWVERPEAIELEENGEGADQVLVIRSSDGSRTLLRFGSAALPARVNGMAK
jgi:Family of unknown function (DUF5335)